MSPEEQKQKELIREAQKMQKKNAELQSANFKREQKIRSREFALSQSPREKATALGTNEFLTATERIAEAEKIYQWLIKDL
jgi:hypothetical protein